MPPLNRDNGAGARRRLEDVSHFFLDTDRAEPPNAIPRERSNGRARIVHLVSVAHDIPGAMVVAGLAALSARSSDWNTRGMTQPRFVEARNVVLIPVGVLPFQLGPASR